MIAGSLCVRVLNMIKTDEKGGIIQRRERRVDKRGRRESLERRKGGRTLRGGREGEP